jgi:cytosine deaminase
MSSAEAIDSPLDLVIGKARLRGREGTFWIGVIGTRIVEISEKQLEGVTLIDADGALVTESFVNAHMHLDKVYTLDLLGDSAITAYTGSTMGDSMAAIEQAAAVKAHYTEPLVEANARKCVIEGLRHGVRHILAFADVDTSAQLKGIRPLLRLREEFAGMVDLHVVAFPQQGLLRDRGAYDLVRDAVALGADYVGGIPWIEYTDADAAEHVDRLCVLAAERNLRVAMLVDDAGDPSLRTTEMLATAMIRNGLQGKGVANHARALGGYPRPSLLRLARLAKEAQLGFVSDPHTGPLHLPVLDLMAQGLSVALGQDDCEDAYYPFGRQNMLEIAFLAAHILGAVAGEPLERMLDAVTTQAAQVLGLTGHRLEVGGNADLVVLDGDNAREVVARHSPPRYVIASGCLVVENTSTSTFSLLDKD